MHWVHESQRSTPVLLRQPAGGSLLLKVVICCMLISGCSTVVSGQNGRDLDRITTPLTDLRAVDLGEAEQLRVVATTNIVADVIKNVAGETLELVTLIPAGADPHTFQPSPGDLRAMTNAHVIFINGAGLEEFLFQTFSQIADTVPIVSLSEGLKLRQFHDDAESEEAHEHPVGDDPHVWFDPFNVMVWAEHTAQALGRLDAGRQNLYQENARWYIEQLEALNHWIEDMVAGVPQESRELITDHLVFGYFADRYGFEMIGAIVPAYSTAAEPSAQELAELNDAIRTTQVSAVFISMQGDTRLAELVAEDTGVDLVSLYTGSLGETGGPADTYLAFMQYDVTAIVQSLGE